MFEKTPKSPKKGAATSRNGASSVLLQYMYTQGFVNGNFGYAMAITVFTLAISVALSMLSRKLTDASEGGQ